MARDRSVFRLEHYTSYAMREQRIALARCVYADAYVVLIDDAFSALDNNTSAFVFARLFSPVDGLLRNKTVVMTSNAVKHFAAASHLVLLAKDGDGCVQGNYQELAQSALFQSFLHAKDSNIDSLDVPMSTAHLPFALEKEVIEFKEDVSLENWTGVEGEAHQDKGRVLSSLLTYIKAAGLLLNMLLLCLLLATWPFFQLAYLYYSRAWTDGASDEKDQKAWRWIGGVS